MAPNTQEMTQDIRKEFDMLIEFVTSEQARTATADQVERGLFKLLLSLGAKLLILFFAVRSQACSREPLEQGADQTLPYYEDRKRTYFSIFGPVDLWRPYFYKKGMPGQCPLDAALSLGADRYSDLLREMMEYLGVYVVYHKVCDILMRLLDLNLSTRVVEQTVADDAPDVQAYYDQQPPPTPASEANILVIQADGKGVPMVLEPSAEPQVRLGKGQKRGHKKEAIVTSVYTIAAMPRTPAEVVASYYAQNRAAEPHPPAEKRPKPQNKHIWATLQGKDTALERLAKQVTVRQGDHIQHQVALCDGCEALQARLEARFHGFSLVLDFIHANEYLWDVANSLLGESNEQRFTWMATRTLRLLSGQTLSLIADFRQLAQDAHTTSAQREQLAKTANYFERNLPYMDYPTYLAKGWPIASGVIEGACRHFVKDRFELSGMRWTLDGAENLLCLRAVAENDDWNAYHTFRKQQRHDRLNSSPVTSRADIEVQALESVPVPETQQANPIRQATFAHNTLNSNSQQDYYKLPLAA
jgi:hypothetical protein